MSGWRRPILIAGVALLASACGANVPPGSAAPASAAAGASGSQGGGPGAGGSATPGITVGLLLPYTESAVNSDRGNAQKRAAELFVQGQGGMLGGLPATLVAQDESINGSLDVTKAQELV
ncbi:MAG TPA: hypothetical protein VIR16_09760, partial [Candidatus Limnocylindrales bacterium]